MCFVTVLSGFLWIIDLTHLASCLISACVYLPSTRSLFPSLWYWMLGESWWEQKHLYAWERRAKHTWWWQRTRRTNERTSERPSINKMKQQRGHSLHLFNTGNKTKFNLKDLFTIYLSCYNHKQMKMFKCYRFPQIESFDSINVLHFRSASVIIEHITCSN